MQLPYEDIPHRRPTRKRTGEILIDMGLITPEQLEEALLEQKTSHLRIGEILMGRGWITNVGLTAGTGPPRRACASSISPRWPSTLRPPASSPRRTPAVTRPSRSATSTSTPFSWPWSTRPTSSPSTTFASSLGTTSSRHRHRRGHLQPDRQDAPAGRQGGAEHRRDARCEPRRWRRRRPRHPRAGRRGAHRQAGQQHHRPSRRRRLLGHPLRAAGQGADRALPHRRRAARDHVHPQAACSRASSPA